MKKEFEGYEGKQNKRGPKRPPSRVPPPPPMYGGRPDRSNDAPRAPKPFGDRRPNFGGNKPRPFDRPRYGDNRGPRPSYGTPRPQWSPRADNGAQQNTPRPSYGAPRPYDSRSPRPNYNAPRQYDPRGPRPTYSPSNRPYVGRGPNDRYRAPIQHSGPAPRNTSWGGSAQWYDEALEKEGTYQKDVILPNLLRLLDLKSKNSVADVACGQGFFSRAFADAGATVSGVDVSSELIKIAESKSESTPDEGGGKKKTKKKSAAPTFSVAPAHETGLKAGKFDHVTLVMAVQNIKELAETFAEASRLLSKNGTLHIVMNHPAFRVPKRSAWGFDHDKGVQFRRVDAYLSDSVEKIVMHPGDPNSESTASFHRPLQSYMKALGKAELAITRLEEWISNRQSQPGARADAENKARSEFPLFLYVQAKKI